MADLKRRLARHKLVGLDTSVWIYHLEGHPRYAGLVRDLLHAIQSGRPRAVVSVVTVMELSVRPYRLDRPTVAAHYEVLVTHFPNVQMADITVDVARRAAQLRADYSLTPADALQVATSLVNSATAWITNDRSLQRLSPVIDIIVLDEMLERS